MTEELTYTTDDGEEATIREGDSFTFTARSTSGPYKKTLQVVEISKVEIGDDVVTYYTKFEGNSIRNTTTFPEATFGTLPLEA